MKTRTSRAIGVSAAIAAIAVSLPLAITAQADPPPTTTATAAPIPDPQGDCDPLRAELKPTGATTASLSTLPVGQALAKIPSLSTFTSAINGGLNPEVNIVPVLENGPYVVFAPNNDAFAKLDPAELETLKTDPAALTKLDYYHVFLGLLGPGDVAGQRPTQEGSEIKVTGKDGDIKVNDTTKVICGGIQASNARIYIVDTVLDPNSPPEPITPTTSFAGTGKPATPTSTATTAPAPQPEG
ncbi:fasciclin domain-containing protein [Mycolicibacterium hodleri]|uniref:Fasciclin domain-containing protein n=1 Tax=Mycolicibacterium hodleri TaxID=49897 RepID=A0A502EG34_9MYCO|nr:fasciclin domain-containing protein [Mycolicibacterium hodleri]TPG35952.1 fasciclin domain-containing protein [Mycolicibacterium hodleri]